MEQLKTGDIILCHGDSGDDMIDKIIEDVTHSPYVHAAIVIKDPWWLNLKGLFVLQSNRGPNSYLDVINKKNSGVTLNRLNEFLSGRQYVCIRSLKNLTLNDKNKEKFINTFNFVHGKPYDKNICHWFFTGLGSFFKCKCLSNNMVPKNDDEFWCSALVFYFYEEMNWSDENIDWSCQTPDDLTRLTVNKPLELGEVWRLK